MFFNPILKVTNARLPQFDIMFQIEHQRPVISTGSVV